MGNDDKSIKDNLNYIFYIEKDYVKCLNECKKYQSQNNISRTVIFTIYKLSSQCFRELGNLKNSIKYANLSLKMADNNIEKQSCLWQLGAIYNNVNIQKSVKYFNKCLNYYESINEQYCIAQVKENLGIVLHNENFFLDSIDIYDIIEEEDYIAKYLTTKNDCLINAYSNLIDLYRNQNNNKKIFSLLHTIKSKDIRSKLEKAFLVA